jgi:hypothetical protein
VKVKLALNEPEALQVSLLAFANRATIARVFNLTLASRSLGMAGGTQTVKLKPKKRLVGSATHFKVELLVVGTDDAGNRVTVTKTIKIT